MYKILKTHAKTLGSGLYVRGEVVSDVEDAAYKLKKGYIKTFHPNKETKEEKFKRRGRPKKK